MKAGQKVRCRIGCIDAVGTVRQQGNGLLLAPVPAVLIHSARPDIVPRRDTRRIRSKCPNPALYPVLNPIRTNFPRCKARRAPEIAWGLRYLAQFVAIALRC